MGINPPPYSEPRPRWPEAGASLKRGWRGPGSLLIWVALTGCALTGCLVGPDYHPPQVAVPEHWSAPIPGTETNATVGAELSQWWASFQDPELNSLMSRATRANRGPREIARAPPGPMWRCNCRKAGAR